MKSAIKPKTSRRRFLEAVGTVALVTGMAPAIVSSRARAQHRTLKILRWKHFVPGYDTWFNDTFVQEWGEKNDTDVMVDNVGLGEINNLAAAEAEARRGHDIVLFLAPPPVFEDSVIDHREIYEECERRYGKAAEFAIRGSYNPRTRKYYGFCDGYAPAVLSYRKDLWDAVSIAPSSWEDVRKGGGAVKLLHDAPVGISLAPEHNSNNSVRAIMYSFGAAEQDADGNPALKSSQTLEAIKFVKALYEEAMVADVLKWDAPANNRFMLSGEGSLTVDTLSIPRAAENKQLPVDVQLSLATLPAGPAGRIGPNFGSYTNIIWQFADNIERAQQFLVDYIGSSKAGLLASGFQNMPSFPGAVPGLSELVAHDTTNSERYGVLADVPATMTNLGYPGYANAATDEIFNAGLLPTMFAKAATGELSPEDALDQADKQVRQIFENGRAGSKI